MKKIILMATLMMAVSCSYKNREVPVGFGMNTEVSRIGNAKAIDLSVYDDRKNRRYIGQKTFGKKTVNISIDKNIAEFLKEKVMQNLMLKGFVAGGDKVVEIHLKELSFKAKRGFPIGKSGVMIRAKVVVKDPNSGEAISKDYNLTAKNRHFISSIKSTDEENINALLQELVSDILEDDDLLLSLSR